MQRRPVPVDKVGSEPGKDADRPVPAASTDSEPAPSKDPITGKVKEIGGPKGPEPTRYGDWEKGGRCSDF